MGPARAFGALALIVCCASPALAQPSIYDVQAPANIPRIARACRQLHGGPRFAGDFDMFVIQGRYSAVTAELGFRVPAVVVSPWSAGGRVCPDVLDHTSLIRLIERRFGVREPNISAFRRRTCGDFTTALRFSGAPAGYPRSPRAITLAAAEAGLLAAQREVFANPAPLVPVTNQPAPGQ